MALAVVLLLGSAGVARADAAPPAGARSNEDVAALALRWYTDMQAGRFDRSQLVAAYSAQLTDEAVQDMSRHLNQYGAAPTAADVLQTRQAGDQSIYLVKLVFPRGDAASLVVGLDAAGKIFGINVMSLPGD